MLVHIALCLILVSTISLSVRLFLRRSGKKWLLRLLTFTWLACLLSASALMAIDASKTYVAPDKVYKGTWYDKGTGRKINDEYDLVGGEGSSPIGTFILFTFSYLIIGYIVGSSLALSKDRAGEQKAILAKVFAFILYLALYLALGLFTIGIYPIFALRKDRQVAS